MQSRWQTGFCLSEITCISSHIALGLWVPSYALHLCHLQIHSDSLGRAGMNDAEPFISSNNNILGKGQENKSVGLESASNNVLGFISNAPRSVHWYSSEFHTQYWSEQDEEVSQPLVSTCGYLKTINVHTVKSCTLVWETFDLSHCLLTLHRCARTWMCR